MNRATIYVDAGFRDPDYIDEVANDWLQNNLAEADDRGLPEVAVQIEAKVDELDKLIS
jgi:hypothetical protein